MTSLKECEIHFEDELPTCDVKALMSRKYKWRKDWAYCHSLEKLYTEETIGFTLNLCCGFSIFGDVRADLDPKCRPDVVCDMRYLPFKPHAFDTVIADPPYTFYNRPGFLKGFFDLARKRVVIDDLPLDWRAGKLWDRKWMVLTRTNGLLIKHGAVYDRKDEQLTGYEAQALPQSSQSLGNTENHD